MQNYVVFACLALTFLCFVLSSNFRYQYHRNTTRLNFNKFEKSTGSNDFCLALLYMAGCLPFYDSFVEYCVFMCAMLFNLLKSSIFASGSVDAVNLFSRKDMYAIYRY